jgi:hypothetical protein
MDRITKSADELQLLRTLCDESAAGDERLELLQFLQNHVFLDLEHQVVFESIYFLFSSGPISAARLAVHLNNRGFPEVDMEKYFPAATANRARDENTNKNET